MVTLNRSQSKAVRLVFVQHTSALAVVSAQSGEAEQTYLLIVIVVVDVVVVVVVVLTADGSPL